MMYAVVPSRIEHIDRIAALMRQSDKDEIAAASGLPPDEALVVSLCSSVYARTGCTDGFPFCMFGVSTQRQSPQKGVIWLLGTDEIAKAGISFLRRNGTMIDRLRRRYSVLENWVDARNTTSIRWLRWLGFTIEEAAPYGAEGLPFHHFYMRGNHV